MQVSASSKMGKRIVCAMGNIIGLRNIYKYTYLLLVSELDRSRGPRLCLHYLGIACILGL